MGSVFGFLIFLLIPILLLRKIFGFRSQLKTEKLQENARRRQFAAEEEYKKSKQYKDEVRIRERLNKTRDSEKLRNEERIKSSNPAKQKHDFQSVQNEDALALQNEMINHFVSRYSVAQQRNFNKYDDELVDNTGYLLITAGRENLIEACSKRGDVSQTETRKGVEVAVERFRLACAKVGPNEYGGDIRVGRANALMWLGISDVILGNTVSSLSEAQDIGPGKAFMEASYWFNLAGEYKMAGRVLQEWGEAMLYDRIQDAESLFIMSSAFFAKANDQERAKLALNRSKNLKQVLPNSPFLERHDKHSLDSVATILGCKNTSELRDVCISAKQASWILKKFSDESLM